MDIKDKIKLCDMNVKESFIIDVWTYFPESFEGLELMFRRNNLTGIIQMKVDENMALAWGYSDLKEIETMVKGYYQSDRVELPEWMNLTNAEILIDNLN